MPKKVIISVLILFFTGFLFLRVAPRAKNVVNSSVKPEASATDIVARNGIHWHAQLTIIIKGKKQPIPDGIGLGGAIAQSMRTEDSTGLVHIYLQGLVHKDDTRIGRFFEIWGKTFNSNCIFDYCNGNEGKMEMLVNGKPNAEFDKYDMQDDDEIQIQYK